MRGHSWVMPLLSSKNTLLALLTSLTLAACGGSSDPCSGDACPVDAGVADADLHVAPAGGLPPSRPTPSVRALPPRHGARGQAGHLWRGWPPRGLHRRQHLRQRQLRPARRQRADRAQQSRASSPGSPCDSDQACSTDRRRPRPGLYRRRLPSPLRRPGTCASDDNCPDFQVCIEGRCFS